MVTQTHLGTAGESTTMPTSPRSRMPFYAPAHVREILETNSCASRTSKKLAGHMPELEAAREALYLHETSGGRMTARTVMDPADDAGHVGRDGRYRLV